MEQVATAGTVIQLPLNFLSPESLEQKKPPSSGGLLRFLFQSVYFVAGLRLALIATFLRLRYATRRLRLIVLFVCLPISVFTLLSCSDFVWALW